MDERKRRYRIGIDVGGTFTDLFLHADSGEVEMFKVLSTPQDPSVGVLDGIATIAKSKGLDSSGFAAQVDTIVHGTTVTTNATLTRRGARCGLLTTEGVRDALEMRRGIREEQYNNRYCNVVPLVPRYLRQAVPGRLDHQGKELAPLSAEEISRALELFRQESVDAVAICFMNAFANPQHEQAAAALVREALPEAFLSVSSEVLPTIRFYNRVSTTVLNAFVGPVLRDYINALTAKLAEGGFGGVLLIMQSSGGVALPEAVLDRPATTLLSGPAAGPRAALAFTEANDSDSGAADSNHSCLVVDMGGTSFDASLVRDGSVALQAEGEIDRLRIALPMLEIVTIGAGGGSIGWLDAGGLLRMGPQSAGAAPGPACYGRGGELPACTDADLVLGYLDGEFFAGGEMPLDRARAERAIADTIAAPLGLSVQEAAAGMYRVINTNMAHGVREITIKRGLDPREFPMVVAGGAGALHACMIADELEIPRVLVPAPASILCAVGMLLSDLQHDHVRSHVAPMGDLDWKHLQTVVGEMVDDGNTQLRREGVAPEQASHQVMLDLRYLKQYHEVTLPVPTTAIEAGDTEAIAGAFHAEHDRLYGYNLAEEGTALELINIRVRSTGRTEKPTLPRIERGDGDAAHALKGKRSAFVPERDAFEELAVYDGHELRAGDALAGPAIIERTNTTIFVSASFTASIDDHGTCVLTRQATRGRKGAPEGGEHPEDAAQSSREEGGTR